VSSSVVIVSYRPTELLGRCIDSVREQADDVVVVDNGSEGGVATEVARAHGARVISLPVNTGFAGGANAGISGATGDLVALLNDDAVAGPSWIAAAGEVLARPEVAAVTPKIILPGKYAELVFDDDDWFSPGDPRPLGRQITSASIGGTDVLERLLGPGVHRLETGGEARWRWTAGRRPVYVRLDAGLVPGLLPGVDLPAAVTEGTIGAVVNGEPVPVKRVVTLLNSAGSYLREDGYVGDCGDSVADDGQFGSRSERFAATGAALVARAETFRRLGRFSGRFFAYWEDADWCWRARLAGMSLVYDPAATIVHVRGQTSGGTTARRVQFLAERNRLLCLLRNAPLGFALAEVRRKRHGGGDDGVAEVLPRWVPVGLAGRLAARRKWELPPSEVFDRWAGVDVPR
jgi:O-antigen biosynthesis protein